MKAHILLLSGSLVLAIGCGCRGIKPASLPFEDPYKNVVISKADLDDVTLIEAVDRLMKIHTELRQKHVEAGMCLDACTSFPGLHIVVRPLSQGVQKKRLSIHLENMTLTEAVIHVASKFGLTLSHEDDSFKEGCFILEDPDYKREPDSSFDPFVKNQEPPNDGRMTIGQTSDFT
jgi:hypothetical protein